MTTNSIASSYMQSLYPGSALTTASPAASSFALAAPTAVAPKPTAVPPTVDNSSDAAFQTALAKMQQPDPALALKLQSFSSQAVAPEPAAASTPSDANAGLHRASDHVEKHPGHKGPHLDPVGSPNSVSARALPPSPTAVPQNPPTFVGYRMMQGQSLSSFVQAQSPDLAQSLFALAA